MVDNMGAQCRDCQQDMLEVDSCTHPYIEINGKIYERNTDYYDVNERCHDCGIENHNGHIHHYGCDVERCPKCMGQLIGCRCRKGEVYTEDPNPEVALKPGEEFCERGGTWLSNDDGRHIMWTPMDSELYLEAAVNPDNYPGFVVKVIRSTEQSLVDHINENLVGWYARRCNLKGVNIDNNMVVPARRHVEADEEDDEEI